MSARRGDQDALGDLLPAAEFLRRLPAQRPLNAARQTGREHPIQIAAPQLKAEDVPGARSQRLPDATEPATIFWHTGRMPDEDQLFPRPADPPLAGQGNVKFLQLMMAALKSS